MDKAKNLYYHRSGKTMVKTSYTNNGRKLENCLLRYFLNHKKEELQQ